jgi:hypothetical protein
MSTRQTGNRHENAAMAEAEKLGYATFAARGSRGPVDVLCFQDHDGAMRYADEGENPPYLVPLVIQVGTTNKPIASTLAELDAAPRPIGSLCIVARRHRAKNRRISWTFHDASGKYDSLDALLKGK